MGGDIARLSKLLGENVKMSVETNVGDARASASKAADGEAPRGGRASGNKKSRESNTTRAKGTNGREKKVKGPKAQRNRSGR
jgi:hypothetical protein